MLVILANSNEGLSYNYANLMNAGKDNLNINKTKRYYNEYFSLLESKGVE